MPLVEGSWQCPLAAEIDREPRTPAGSTVRSSALFKVRGATAANSAVEGIVAFVVVPLQQGVRRFPINLRPQWALPRALPPRHGVYSSRLYSPYQATGDDAWRSKAEWALDG